MLTSAADQSVTLGGSGVLLLLALLLVRLGKAAAVVLVVVVVTRWLGREWLIVRTTRLAPEQRREIRAAARSVPLLRRVRRLPADPYALDHEVRVEPWGDGRPGERFLAPGPAWPTPPFGPDGSRTDATVTLARGVHLLVVCLGRVGRLDGGHVLQPAEQRVHDNRAAYEPPQHAIGPVDRVETALGTGWRTTCAFAGGRVLTDTHVDHDGWAYVIGVLSADQHARSVEVLDRVLATWHWIDDGGARVRAGVGRA